MLIKLYEFLMNILTLILSIFLITYSIIPTQAIFLAKKYVQNINIAILIIGILYLLLIIAKIIKITRKKDNRKSIMVLKDDNSTLDVTFDTINETIKGFVIRNENVNKIAATSYQKKESLYVNCKMYINLTEQSHEKIIDLKQSIIDYIKETFGIEIKKINLIIVNAK